MLGAGRCCARESDAAEICPPRLSIAVAKALNQHPPVLPWEPRPSPVLLVSLIPHWDPVPVHTLVAAICPW